MSTYLSSNFLLTVAFFHFLFCNRVPFFKWCADDLFDLCQVAPQPTESPHPVVKCLSFSGTLLPNINGKDEACHARSRLLRQSLRKSSTAPFTLMHEIKKLEQLQEQLGEEANRALEVLQKEVACHRLGNQDAAETIAKLKEEITRLHTQGSTIADLEEQLENVQKSIDKLVMSLPNNDQPSADATKNSKSQSKKKKLLPLSSSNSANRQSFLRSPCSPLSAADQVVESEMENRAPVHDNIAPPESPQEADQGTPWHVTFREQRQQIIELWDVCFVPIIHRTQFYLLFKGDPADQIYMEVELRRLTWLQQHLAENGNASPAPGADEPTVSVSSR